MASSSPASSVPSAKWKCERIIPHSGLPCREENDPKLVICRRCRASRVPATQMSQATLDRAREAFLALTQPPAPAPAAPSQPVVAFAPPNVYESTMPLAPSDLSGSLLTQELPAPVSSVERYAAAEAMLLLARGVGAEPPVAAAAGVADSAPRSTAGVVGEEKNASADDQNGSGAADAATASKEPPN